MTRRTVLSALVVDDEKDVRDITAEMLHELGYDSVQAAHAQEALRMLGAGAVDLVVTDVMMPGAMDGLGLAEIIRISWPTTRVVCVSGYAPDPARLAAVCNHFLMKPYSYGQLALAITA
ncbi:MAG: integral rane sensor hybrid histidine kinase [Rhodospirillales bacterium]|jgi:CheY-like chemotaxis protein|nr:integral rane sensor hybrid histidine kinase [Rhodospirillales bacterium]